MTAWGGAPGDHPDGDRSTTPADPRPPVGRRVGGRARPVPEGLRRPPRRAPAHRGRRRLGQDPGADTAHRPPDRHQGGRPVADPGHHVHQQGGGRDASPGRGPGRARAERMWVSTFHSACVRILRAHGNRLGYKGSFTIYDDADSRRLIEIIARELDIDTKKLSPRSCSARSARPSPERQGPMAFRAGGHLHLRPADRRRLRPLPAADAGGQRHGLRRPPLNAVRLFDVHPDVLEHYRTRFPHILIDEYQDTNAVQNALVVQLAGGHRNIVVVGDSDQSVYRFRGADISNILDFEQAFPDATAITLDQNFRSTQTILEAANAVITNNVPASRRPCGPIRGRASRSCATAPRTNTTRPMGDPRDRPTALGPGPAVGDVATFYRTKAPGPHWRRGGPAESPTRSWAAPEAQRAGDQRGLLADLRYGASGCRRSVGAASSTCPTRRGGHLGGEVGAVCRRRKISFGHAVADTGEAGIGGKAGKALEGLADLLAELRSQMALPELVDENGTRWPPPQLEAPAGPGGGETERRPRWTGAAGDPPFLSPGDLAVALVERTGYRSELLSEGTPMRCAGGERRHPPRAGVRVPDAARVPGGDGPGRRLGRVGRRRHQGVAHDDAHRQGPRVPGGVPRRHGGRDLPPCAVPGRPRRARGGAAAVLRGHHPGGAPPLRLPRVEPDDLRTGRSEPAESLPQRDPGRTRPRRGRGPRMGLVGLLVRRGGRLRSAVVGRGALGDPGPFGVR